MGGGAYITQTYFPDVSRQIHQYSTSAELTDSKHGMFVDGALGTEEIYWSCRMGNPTICIGENKGADQLRGNREADQRLCFRYTDSTIPLVIKSKISSL